VTAANLGDDAPDAVGACAPRARLSRAALQRNARALGDRPADLRRDAWGHGILQVAAVLVDAGVREALVDAGDEDAVAMAGLEPRPRGSAVGDGVYGATPGTSAVMTLEGTVLSTKALRTGEGVSYGYLHRATSDTRIALVTGGYAQGVVRSLGGRTSVLIAGHRLPIVGRVAMDVCVVDIGDADVPRGATAIFFGGDGAPTVADWSSTTGLSAAEILTAVGLNARREWIA
jgi:alanine racemase